FERTFAMRQGIHSLSDCRSVGMSECRTVGLSECRTVLLKGFQLQIMNDRLQIVLTVPDI
ncbi:hypothetical protein, partial [Microcoleus sp. herbarium12]|uniref:hypothetical protein n=1 Tax=Microcoleus sp. herbarium12 TaxID=3055437 RepID=UPI002FD2523A